MNLPIFYAPDLEDNYVLSDDESSHCLRVLRLGVGDELMVTDGRGHFFHCRITSTVGKRCRVEVVERTDWVKPWRNYIHIAIAPTKNFDRMEWLIEKIAEIGFDELTFLDCRFSERHVVKMERVERILVSAIKQSQKAFVPRMNEMTPFPDFISREHLGRKFIAHCNDGDKIYLPTALLPSEDVTIMIGPEGDFCQDEVAMALKAGFEPVSLGNSRLRTETAAFVACVAANLPNQG